MEESGMMVRGNGRHSLERAHLTTQGQTAIDWNWGIIAPYAAWLWASQDIRSQMWERIVKSLAFLSKEVSTIGCFRPLATNDNGREDSESNYKQPSPRCDSVFTFIFMFMVPIGWVIMILVTDLLLERTLGSHTVCGIEWQQLIDGVHASALWINCRHAIDGLTFISRAIIGSTYHLVQFDLGFNLKNTM